MDRLTALLAAFMIGLSIAVLSIGCKTADEGPKPFVMPARPVINVPPARPTGSPPYPPAELIPQASTGRTKASRSAFSVPRTAGIPASTLAR